MHVTFTERVDVRLPTSWPGWQVLTVLGDFGQVGDDLGGLPLVGRGRTCERHG